MSTSITIATSDGGFPALSSTPSDPPRGAVIVVQEAFGLTNHIADVCDRFAAAGWLAVAPSFFHRDGAPSYAYDDWDGILGSMGRLAADHIAADLSATLDHLAGEGFGPERSAVVGFCMGGTVTLFAATLHALGAAVTFYGGGVAEGRFGIPALIELAPDLRTPWLGIFGDLDKGIPVDQVEHLRAAAASAPVATDLVRYADADHGFHNDERPEVYDSAAAADAWGRALTWLDAHVAPA